MVAGNGKLSLLSDSENYKNTLQTYYRYMHQLPKQREWMQIKFGLRIRAMFDSKTTLSFLGIGTGAGEVDIDFLNVIVKHGAERHGNTGYNVVYQVVEPNPVNVELFKNTVSKKPEFARVQFKWYTGFFDQFCDEFKRRDDNKFDFVHFVRVFYHINSEKAFDDVYNQLLAKNGIMCGVGENENAFWPKMMYFLADHKMEHEGFTGSGPVSQNYFLPGWQQQARVRNWKYESYVTAYKFDVTPIFDPTSVDGNYLLDFIMHAKEARKNVDRNVINDFFIFLDSNKEEEEIVEHGVKVKKFNFPCELGAIMITKE